MKHNAIILSRVSTAGQDLEQQTKAVKAEVVRLGYNILDDYIIEDIESAVKLSEEERLGLNRLKELIENDNSIKAVFVYEVSRISRQPKILYSIRDFLQEHKVQLYILKPYLKVFKDNWEIDETANIMFSIFGALSENEGYLRKERMKRGKIKAMAEGRAIGGNISYGFEVEQKTKKIIECPKEKEMILELFRLYLTGLESCYTIAKIINEKGYLKRNNTPFTAYDISKLLNAKIYVERGFITQEMFDKCKVIANSRIIRPKIRKNVIYYAKGLFIDDEGHNYRCKKTAKAYCNAQGGKGVSVNLLDTLLWELTKECRIRRIEDPDYISTEKKNIEKEIKAITTALKVRAAEVEKYTNLIDNVVEKEIEGRLSPARAKAKETEYRGKLEESKKEVVRLKNAIKELEESKKSVVKWSKERVEYINKITDENERLQMIREEINRVVYLGMVGGDCKKKLVRVEMGRNREDIGVSYDFLLTMYPKSRKIYRVVLYDTGKNKGKIEKKEDTGWEIIEKL